MMVPRSGTSIKDDKRLWRMTKPIKGRINPIKVDWVNPTLYPFI